MRRIQKKILLEEFVSRLPSIIPAYKNNKLYYFDDNSLSDRSYEYTSNYGMIPVNITVSASTSGEYGFCTDTAHCYSCDCLCIDNGGTKIEYPCYDDFSSGMATYSFRRISSYYHFFKEYYHLLKDHGHCNKIYTSATQYYDTESKNPRYLSQMKYGTDRATYEALDNTFMEYGGKVSASTANAKSENETITDVWDEGFYKFICNRMIPTFTIPSEYSEYWNRHELYYPDVIKWLGWLNSRTKLETDAKFTKDDYGIEHWDCKSDGIEDCCECEEYFKRGGNRIYEKMKAWYESLQYGIQELNEVISANTNCFTPTICQNISLTTSLDNLGEMSILSDEYKLGKDYRVAEGLGSDKNTKSGTTIVYDDGKSIILSGDNGFCFDTKYMEKVFKEDDWGSYSDKYRKGNPSEFRINYQYYAYNEENKLISGNDTSEVESQFCDYYPIIYRDAAVINGNFYDIIKTEIGVYNNKNYFVYRDEITNTPYTIIGGKKIFAEFYPYGEEPYYYFTIFKNNEKYYRKKAVKEGDRVDDIDESFRNDNYVHYGRTPKEENLYDYIQYEGVYYSITGETIEIDSVTYLRISGYSYDKNGETYYILHDDSSSIKYTDDFLDVDDDKVTIKDGRIKVNYKSNPNVYNANEIKGTTISKIDSLKAVKPLSDDVGNELQGLYDISGSFNFQPKEGSELEPLYQVGNTYFDTKSQYVNTQIDQNNIKGNTNYLVGNIITEMSFYYKNSDGSPNDKTKYTVTFALTNDGTKEINGKDISGKDISVKNISGNTSLSAITYATSVKEKLEKDYNIFEDDIYCDITYYCGATLSREQGKNFVLADKSKYNYGVEYHETVRFKKKDEQYYLKKPSKKFLPFFKNKAENHSVSYPITVYELVQEISEIKDGENTMGVPLAMFKTEIPVWSGESIMNSFDKFSGDTSIEEEIYPVFMEEYRIGSASMQKVDSNIFIDRGINAAFEKHIKLGEVATLEALEQYGNGWFKMIEN